MMAQRFRRITTAFWPARPRSTGIASRPRRSGRNRDAHRERRRRRCEKDRAGNERRYRGVRRARAASKTASSRNRVRASSTRKRSFARAAHPAIAVSRRAKPAVINKIWEGPKVIGAGLTATPVQQMLAGAQPFADFDQPRATGCISTRRGTGRRSPTTATASSSTTRVRAVGPVMAATNNPDLDAFRKRGGKLILWHGWSDPGMCPRAPSTITRRVAKRDGGDYKKHASSRVSTWRPG